MTENFVSPSRLCEYLDVSEDTMRSWMLNGMPYVRVGRVLRFKLTAVDQWLTEQGSAGQAGRVVSLTERKPRVKRPNRRVRVTGAQLVEELDLAEFEDAS